MDNLTPITREEMLMNDEPMTPITREEKILAGEDLPPVTRREYFLKKYRHAGGEVMVEGLEVTANGTYTAPDGKAYSPVEVDVPMPDNAYLLKEASGSLVSFNDGADLPMPSFICNIDAVQDLHGQDGPWVGGAGKNKLPMTVDGVKSNNTSGTWSGNSYAKNGVTFTILTDNDDNVIGIKCVGTATAETTFISCDVNLSTLANGDYAANGCPSNGGSSSYRLRGSGGLFGDTGSGATFTKTSDTSSAVEIVIANNYAISSNGIIFTPMIRLSTETDPTFAPYSNICPISGWDEVNVTRTGKNLFDKTATDTNKGFISGKWINQTGNTFSYGDWSVSEYIRVDGEKITVSGMTVAEQVSSGRGGYCCYDKYKNVLGGGTYNALTQIITLPTNTEYIRISVWNQNKDVCQLELGETATAYEPYNGQTYTIDLDGTRYGGTLDVVNGVLTLTHEIKKVNTLNWYYLQNTFYSGSVWISADGSPDINSDFVCSFAKSVNKEWNQLSNNECTLKKNLYSQGYYSLCVKNTEYTDATEFKNSLDSSCEITFPLATPIEIQLTPTIIKSLHGENNLFASTGEIETLEYFTKEA